MENDCFLDGLNKENGKRGVRLGPAQSSIYRKNGLCGDGRGTRETLRCYPRRGGLVWTFGAPSGVWGDAGPVVVEVDAGEEVGL